MRNNSSSRHVASINTNGNPGRRELLVTRLDKSKGDIVMMQDVRSKTNTLDFIFTNEKGGKTSTEIRMWEDVGSNHLGIETVWASGAYQGEVKYKALKLR